MQVLKQQQAPELWGHRAIFAFSHILGHRAVFTFGGGRPPGVLAMQRTHGARIATIGHFRFQRWSQAIESGPQPFGRHFLTFRRNGPQRLPGQLGTQPDSRCKYLVREDQSRSESARSPVRGAGQSLEESASGLPSVRLNTNEKNSTKCQTILKFTLFRCPTRPPTHHPSSSNLLPVFSKSLSPRDSSKPLARYAPLTKTE